METPTPVSNGDRQKMHVPLDTSVETIWPNLNSYINAKANEQRREKDTTDNIIPLEPPVEPAQRAPKTTRKRKLPTADKDEWAPSGDDTDDEETTPTSEGNEVTTSEHFQSKAVKKPESASSKKQAKRSSKGTTFHTLSGTNKGPKPPKALSMSKTAVDYRERHKQTESWGEKVCAFVDKDLLEAADKEGGMTPQGRTYKAIYRIMVRWKSSPSQAMTPPDSSDESSLDEVAKLKAENQMLKRRMEQAAKLLGPVASGGNPAS